MFKIYDGRDFFYQWDINQKLIVEDGSIDEVHFCNRTGSCSFVREVYLQDGLYLVNVPNTILQDNLPIKAYAYDLNHTEVCETFQVERRSRPESYVFTDDEQKLWADLEDRIKEMESDIDAVVRDYLEENPPQIDLDGYYTKDEVDAAIETIELTPGPAGPQGEPGPQGIQGEIGPEGPQGPAGNDYVLTEADKAEIAGMVEVTGAEAVPVYDLGTITTKVPNAKSDEVKEIITRYKNGEVLFKDYIVLVNNSVVHHVSSSLNGVTSDTNLYFYYAGSDKAAAGYVDCGLTCVVTVTYNASTYDVDITSGKASIAAVSAYANKIMLTSDTSPTGAEISLDNVVTDFNTRIKALENIGIAEEGSY